MEPLLTIDRCTMRFGGLTALQDLCVALAPGEFIGIIGPNGAGKTTLFNLLTGIYRPTSGSLTFGHHDLAPLKPHAINDLGIARTFQNIRLFGDMTVMENVTASLHRRITTSLWGLALNLPKGRREEKQAHDEAAQLLTEFRLIDHRDCLAKELPYGLQRKLEIVRALATHPKLLLLDEPAAGTNIGEKQELIALIRSLNRERGLAIILIEHDMNVVMSLCPKIYVLDYGVMIAWGTPEEIRQHPKVIEAYLGSTTLQ